MEDTRVAQSVSRIRNPGYGNEVQTGIEIEFMEEVCGQTNQVIYRAALSEYENNGDGELPTEEIIERRVESCGPGEHYAMEKDYVQSPESEVLSDEQSDDDNLFEDVSDTDFSDVEEFNVDDARSETSLAASLNSVACDNVTAIASNFGGGVKASRDDMLGAWVLMELKTRAVDQKFCNATHVAAETQMRTSECTANTLENLTNSGGIDRPLVSETQKGKNYKAEGDRGNFAQFGKELDVWVQSQLDESQLNGSVSVEPTDEHQKESAGVDRTGKSNLNSITTVLHRWVRDEQQPRREDSSDSSTAVNQKVDRGIELRLPGLQSCCWRTNR